MFYYLKSTNFNFKIKFMNILDTTLKSFKLLIISFAVFIFQMGVAQAQITVTQQAVLEAFDDLSVTQDLSLDEASIAPLVDLNGPDQTWDFSDIEFDGFIQGTFNLLPNDGTAPGSSDPHFAQADFALAFDIEMMDTEDGMAGFQFDVFYTYISVDDETNQGLSFGEVMTIHNSEDQFITYARPPRVDFQFPLNYQDSWSYEYEEEFSEPGFTDTRDYQVLVEIDAWGELITPETTHNVLRMKTTRTDPESGSQDGEVDYQFIDENGRTVATIEVNEEFDEASASLSSYDVATSNEPADELTRSFELNQNYPNPFNPSTIISFDLPSNSNVILEVFDVMGRRVAQLIDGHRQAGTHEVAFRAGHLPSGIYTYRLTADGVSQTRSLTLIK